jgi:transcription antitermination factor NusG
MENSWLVLRTKSRQENVVEHSLCEKRIACFLPKKQEMRQWKDRNRSVSSPLFPGYIFVQPSSVQFTDLRYIPGSCGLVLFNRKPAEIPLRDLESIKIMSESGYPLTVRAAIAPGQKVIVLSGPLKGVEGELIRMKNQRRLVINAHLLGKSVGLEINTDEVQPL